jgi:hypothetical protein
MLVWTWPITALAVAVARAILLPRIVLLAFLFGMPVALPAAFLGGFVLRKIAETWPSALR